MTDQPVTRGEFAMLAQQVTDNGRRLDSIDASGTRGVGIVQVQLTDLAKDLSGLSQRMDAHEKEHEQDQRDRRTSRRWLVTTVIAVMVMVEGPLLYLVTQFARG